MKHTAIIAPRGVGATMFARQLCNTPDNLQRAEAADKDIVRLHWLARLPECELRNKTQPVPFRAPHHTVSRLGMVGNFERGYYPRPGELSLAHGGILFLDEIAEFAYPVIKAICEAMEYKSVNIGVLLPADFRLVVHHTPCPCGLHGSPKCACTEASIERWDERAAPILQRCPVHIGEKELQDAVRDINFARS